MKRIHIEVSDDLHRSVRMAAAASGITLKQFVISACEEKVSRDEQAKVDHLNSHCPDCGGETETTGQIETCKSCGWSVELVAL